MSLSEITNEVSQVDINVDINEYVRYFKESLKQAGDDINRDKQNKALKDVVGDNYEKHWKRVWERLGFRVDKNRNGAAFDVDWSIYYGERLVAFEEDKGHYVDSCFLERCIFSFIKTIHNLQTQGRPIPKLILRSFTKYNLYDIKMNEISNLFSGFPKFEILLEKFKYIYLNHCDRFKKEEWFKPDYGNTDNPYELYQNDELIREEIRFMLSLRE